MSQRNINIPVGSCLTVMFLILFTLKLAGPLAETSWWWITCPLWAMPALGLALCLLAGIVLGLAAIVIGVVSYLKERKK